MSDAPTLSWTLHATEPGVLEVRYTVENPGTEDVWLLDLPLVYPPGAGVEADPSAMQVRAGEPGTVRFVRGYLAPSGLPQFELLPAIRPLPAGGSVEGSARISLPLQSWHPNENVHRPIEATKAVLEVGYLAEADELSTRSLVDGTEVRTPSLQAAKTQRSLVGEPIALP